MFNKVLIANRGEIAVRIIRACRELGISPVVVYSEADKNSLAVKLADETVCIGPAPAAKSYLYIPAIIAAAEKVKADAIHPGYGFLAENAKFASICEQHNIQFIGPSPEAIATMGDKAKAKEAMQKAGVPVTPGSNGVVATDKEALAVASEIGYPVMIKAAAGGGGKGMRLAENEAELKRLLATARSEAEAAFGNPSLYIEKFIVNPRHIEVQILADKYGQTVFLGERDCSIQRRHQKLIEEAPSPAVTAKLRQALGETAVKAAKAINYHTVGTVEFLMDDQGHFYFMEMNTRIQVEHPVTEMITGVDLIKEQIKMAAGEKLTLQQEDIKLNGHAIEFRINAEDPENNFLPQGGLVKYWQAPGGPGVRVDTHLFSGYEVPIYYDSLLAKLIVWGRDRKEALARAKRSLNELVLEGPKTTVGLFLKLLENKQFKEGKYTTRFVIANNNRASEAIAASQ